MSREAVRASYGRVGQGSPVHMSTETLSAPPIAQCQVFFNFVKLLHSYVSVNPSFSSRTFDSFSTGLGTYIPASASGEANAEGGNLPKVLGNAEIRRDEFGEFGFVSMYFTHH